PVFARGLLFQDEEHLLKLTNFPASRRSETMRKLASPILVTAILLLLCCGLFAQSTSIKPLTFVGTTKFKAGKASGVPLNNIVQGPDVDVTFDIPGISGNNSPARVPANFVPRPAGNPIGSGSFL